jgi:hypothetical protein
MLRLARSTASQLPDLWRLITFRNVVPHNYWKYQIIKRAARQSGASQMIETGTYLGQMARRCAPHFQHVVTIELDATLASNAKRSLRDCSNVEVIEGDAVDVLPSVLERPEVDNLLIYLDGHYSGSGTARGATPEPACEELEIISKFLWKLRAIIIDDFRSFGSEEGWPSKSELFKVLERHFAAHFDIHVHLDQVLLIRK